MIQTERLRVLYLDKRHGLTLADFLARHEHPVLVEHLRYLHLPGHDIRNDDLPALLEALEKFPNLQSVYLQYDQLDIDSVRYLDRSLVLREGYRMRTKIPSSACSIY